MEEEKKNRNFYRNSNAKSPKNKERTLLEEEKRM